MTTTSKSPKLVLLVAWLLGRGAFRQYSHRCSPKKYTQPQLFACLVLKEFLKLDYRGLTALLKDCPDLQKTIGLHCVPHYTTFHKAAQRLLVYERARRLLKGSVQAAIKNGLMKSTVDLAALDATGLESHHVSAYFQKRKEKSKKSKRKHKQLHPPFPKMGVISDTASHLVMTVEPTRGPGPDAKHFRSALDHALELAKIRAIAADAGYDSEAAHEYARARGVRSFIPPLIGRPTSKPPSTYWRRQMKSRLHLTRYKQRWQVETDFSMMKRLLGSALRARKYWNQCREIFLMALTLNIMILMSSRGFSTKQTGFN